MISKDGLSIKKVNTIVNGELIRFYNDDPIRFLSIDSRKITTAQNTLFFAIPGERNDGHKYINNLIEKGVKNFVISTASSIKNTDPNINFILVKNVIDALQSLAAYHRNQFQIKTIGITGSNGKTIVKEWLSQLLDKEFEIIKSPKSYNSQVGVPLSVWSINEHHNLAIFEAGISMPGEMERLEKIIQPNVGIITNIGSPHSENFENNQKKTFEKIKLFEHVDSLIYCSDYKEIMSECYVDVITGLKV